MAVDFVRKKLVQSATSISEISDKADIRTLAQELVAEISAAAPEQSEELLSALIAELALSAADERRRNERRQHQRACVAAAQARGVQFGRPRTPLPDNFDQSLQLWQDGKISLREAARACGMEKTTFQRAAMRRDEDMEHTV